MREAIIQKLKRHLANGITREADVVYFMSEVRKILEHETSASKYPALSFYANWCLHTKIDRQSFANDFLTALDEGLVQYESDNNAGALFSVIVQHISFHHLWNELIQFCEERHLDTGAFLKDRASSLLLIDVILDCPVLTKRELKQLQEFFITRNYSFESETSNSVAFWCLKTRAGQQFMGPLF